MKRKTIKGIITLISVILVGAIALSFIACDEDDFVPEYAVGDTGPGGGKIFYVSTSGFTVHMVNTGDNYKAHYLEASPEPLLTQVKWCNCTYPNGCYTGAANFPDVAGNESNEGWTDPNKAILDTIGYGRSNTALIAAYHTADDFNNNAAIACDIYSNNGKGDWFLPSIGELYWLCKNREDAGTGTYSNIFYSSSQNDASNVWTALNENHRIIAGKGNSHNVRPIRAF